MFPALRKGAGSARFYAKKPLPRWGRGLIWQHKKRPGWALRLSVRLRYAMAASLFASFAFLFAALFLWSRPFEQAESMAETVSG